MTIRPPTLSGSDVAEALGFAVVVASIAPLLLLDAEFNVLAVSDTFRRAFGIAPGSMRGQPIFALGDGAWNMPQLRSLLRATLAGQAEIEAYELELNDGARGQRRLVLNAHSLDYDPGGMPRIMLTITDMTAARLDQARHDAALAEKDALLRQRTIMLQEVRHRIANSLQIIASVLLQNARRVNSEESRGHLRDAHTRVMSVAALQHQLAASSLEGVPLAAYFTHLCESIGASMIADPKRISLTVQADESIVSSDVSISLGLVVTELVINALKHAFGSQRPGAITVGYVGHGDDWTLTVADDGVGMPTKTKYKAGLGTSIVEALAKQLNAEVSVADNAPGVVVTVLHAALHGLEDQGRKIA